MRKSLILCMLLFFGLVAQAQTHHTRKKVAVVLSGGGAKGMAHIGVLKVIEDAGIPVDIVTGTSMGSIIGGLYCIGYDAHCMDSIVRLQDWSLVLSDKVDVRNLNLNKRKKENTYMLSRDIRLGKNRRTRQGGLIQGKNLSKLFARLAFNYRDSIDFNDLPIPFACVATNIIDNTEYVFHRGSLTEAMRASMSIPGAFTPIRKGDMVLVDGGLRNNYPADIAREMGADIVIGVTVQEPPKTASDFDKGASVIGQIVDINCKNKYDENIAKTDILISTDTKGYGAASFSTAAIDTLIRRGEEAAMKQWPKLEKLRKELGIAPGQKPEHLVKNKVDRQPDKVKIADIVYEDVDEADQRYIAHKFKLNKRDSIQVNLLDQIANTMRADLYYNDADCYITPTENGERLHIASKGQKDAKASLGLRFDTEELVALQANLGLFVRSKAIPMAANFTLRLGKRTMAKADFALYPSSWGKVNVSYQFRHQDINIYSEGTRDVNLIYNQHTVRVVPFDFNIRNFNFRLGGRYDFYHHDAVLQDVKRERWNTDLKNLHLISYQGEITFNSENHWNFPSKGANFEAGYGYYTDNFVGYDDHSGFSIVNAMWRISFPLNNRLTLQPMLYGRLIEGTNAPYVLQNIIGGDQFHYFSDSQHMPFAGVAYVEQVKDKFVAAQLRLQQRILDNNYVIAKISGYLSDDKFDDLFDHGPKIGCQAAYYYNSVLGPIGGSIGWSSKTKTPNYYINLGFVF